MATRTIRRRQTSGPTTEKLAISLPRDLAEKVRERAKTRGTSVSAFIASVLAEKLEEDGLREILDEIFADKPMTDEERAWADQLLFGP